LIANISATDEDIDNWKNAGQQEQQFSRYFLHYMPMFDE